MATKDAPAHTLNILAASRDIKQKTGDSYERVAHYLDMPKDTLITWRHKYRVDGSRVDRKKVDRIVESALQMREQMQQQEAEPKSAECAAYTHRTLIESECVRYANESSDIVTVSDVHDFSMHKKQTGELVGAMVRQKYCLVDRSNPKMEDSS